MAVNRLLTKEALEHLCELVNESPALVRNLTIRADVEKGVILIDVTRMVEPRVFHSAVGKKIEI